MYEKCKTQQPRNPWIATVLGVSPSIMISSPKLPGSHSLSFPAPQLLLKVRLVFASHRETSRPPSRLPCQHRCCLLYPAFSDVQPVQLPSGAPVFPPHTALHCVSLGEESWVGQAGCRVDRKKHTVALPSA